VLIPAHNEEKVLAPTLDAIQRDCRAGDLVVVVADHCTDATVQIARAQGAMVLELTPESGRPGRATARQRGVEYALGLHWDALVMIDADSRIAPGFFAACERMLATGALALQVRSEAARGDGLLAHSYIAAFALQGVTIPRGRDRLGLAVRLRGTGMVLRRTVAERYRFRAPASEDLWYSLDLCLDGIVARHVETAGLRSENVASWKAASGQRVRYEAGRMSAAREYFLPLLRRHSPASLEAAWHLVTPPFAVAVALLGASAGLSGLAGATPVALTAVALILAYAIDLSIGLIQTRVGAQTWLALLGAPWYVPWKVWVQVRAFASLRRRVADYGPTLRR
jgi:glycosyltransferase involved in cell wall biosynthesis